MWRDEYELDDVLEWANHCHCTTCGKVPGAAFGTFGHALARNFCRICGSNMPTVSKAEDAGEEDEVRIPLGTLDDDPHFEPKEHFFVSSRVAWLTITDKLPQFDTLPE